MSSATRGHLAEALRRALDVSVAPIAHTATDEGNPGRAIQGQQKHHVTMEIAQVAQAAQPRATADTSAEQSNLNTAAEDNTEREAIQAEAPLPPLGTPERIRSDEHHRRYVEGLLRAAIRPEH